MSDTIQTHPISKVTFMYGGIAYPDITDEMIRKCINNKTYDTDLMSQVRGGDAERIAGIACSILQGVKFTIEMWYFGSFPYVGNLYDGNHRLRAHQYLGKDIRVVFSIETRE